MLILGTTGTLLRMTPGTAGQIASSYSFVDDLTTGPTFTPGGATNVDLTTTTTTTVVPAPASNTQRNVKRCTISNESASVATTLLVEQYDGTNSTCEWKGTLQPGERIILDESGQWIYYDAAGRPQVGTGSGQFIQSTLLTTGTTFTTGPNTRTIKLRMVGGGGGGGGCTSVASAASAAGGGASGCWAEKVFAVTPNTAYTYAIGSAGAGASGAAGGAGGNTTFQVGATTVTAFGAGGAVVATAVTTLSAYRGGANSSPATNGDIDVGGSPGQPGMIVVVATPLGVSGSGGSSPLGAGGASISAVGNGSNASGYGAGGGGAMTGAATVRTGGNGTPGCIVVEEFT